MALATAAVIRETNGIAFPPSMPDRIAVQLASQRMSETPEIVLVAREYSTALAIAGAISWARVVGIAAEAAIDSAPVPAFPAVVDLPNLVSVVNDDELILVDAINNFVFPDPDPMYLAQYTAEHDRIAPRRRIYLDEGHAPARTVDGHVIQVYAWIADFDTLEETHDAVEQGADGIFVPIDAIAAVSTRHGEMGTRNRLHALLNESAGKPLLLAKHPKLSPDLLVELAVDADLTVAVKDSFDKSDQQALRRLTLELDVAENFSFDSNTRASIPRLAGLLMAVPAISEDLESVEKWVESISAAGATRAVFSLDAETLSEGLLVEMEKLVAACGRNLIPVYVSVRNFSFNLFGQNSLENSLETAIRLVLGAGIVGLLVDFNRVAETKAVVSEINLQECRESYWSLLGEMQPE